MAKSLYEGAEKYLLTAQDYRDLVSLLLQTPCLDQVNNIEALLAGIPRSMRLHMKHFEQDDYQARKSLVLTSLLLFLVEWSRPEILDTNASDSPLMIFLKNVLFHSQIQQVPHVVSTLTALVQTVEKREHR